MIETVTTSLKRLVRTKITDGPHTTPELVDEGIPFISAEGVVEGKIDFSKKRGFIKRKDHNLFAQKLLPQYDDIFFVKSGSTTGKIAIVDTKEEFNVWSPLALIRVNELIDSKLLFYILQSPSFQLQVRQYWSFGTQPNIGMNKIEKLRVTFPKSISVQKEIVLYLDKIFDKANHFIQSKQRFIELLKEQRQSIITHAVTKGIDENVKMKETGIDWMPEVPEHWEIRRLKYLVELYKHNKTVTNPSDFDFKLALENIDNWTGKYIQSVNPEFEGEGRFFYPGDVLFGKLRPYLAKAFLPERKGICVSEILVFSPNPELIQSEFLFQRILTKGFIDIVDGSTYGAKMPRANWDFIGNMRIAYHPTIQEQKQIVEHIKSETRFLDIAINKAEREIELMKEYREAMIAEAVTGKRK